MNILSAQYRESVMQATSKNQVLRRLTTSMVVVSCLALGFIVALQGYRGLMADKVLYGVSIGGVPLGGTSITDLRNALKLKASTIEQSPLSIHQSTTVTSLAELGIQIDIDAAQRDLMATARAGSIDQQLIETFSMLVTPKAVAWQFKTSDETMPALHEALVGYVKDSENAHFQLENNELTVKADVSGIELDLPATIAHMETSYLRGVPTVLRVALVPSIAKLTTTDLEAIYSQASALIDQPVTLAVNGKLLLVPREVVLSWISPERTKGVVKVAVDESAIANWVTQATSSVTQHPVDRQVLASGTVVTEGRDGRVVDATATAVQVKTAIALVKQQPVIVQAVVTTVKPTTRVVAADTTAGLYVGKYVEIDLSGQMLYQYEGQNLIATHRVSTGKPSTPTPTGTYSINDKHPRAYSSSFGLYLPYWMPFIGSSYGLHALPEWPGGYKEGENHLGRAVSHGCIRLSTSAAASVYGWVDIGTVVVIHK